MQPLNEIASLLLKLKIIKLILKNLNTTLVRDRVSVLRNS